MMKSIWLLVLLISVVGCTELSSNDPATESDQIVAPNANLKKCEDKTIQSFSSFSNGQGVLIISYSDLSNWDRNGDINYAVDKSAKATSVKLEVVNASGKSIHSVTKNLTSLDNMYSEVSGMGDVNSYISQNITTKDHKLLFKVLRNDKEICFNQITINTDSN